MSAPTDATSGIAVMAKASRPGVSKTRLIPALGAEDAARLNTAFVDDVCANLLAAAAVAPIRGYVAFGPPETRPFFDFLPPAIGLVEAWQPDFGDTLMAAMDGVLARGHGSACLVNADSPTLPPAYLAQAADRLKDTRCDLVLGPSDDGGYYLIGARRVHRELYADMVWSVASVFDETMRRAGALGLAVHVLPRWYDVDDGETLARLRAELFEGRAYAPAGIAPGEARATRGLLASLAVAPPAT